MILNELKLIAMLCIVVADVMSWPTLKLKILKHSYHLIEPDFVNYNMTEKDGELIAYYEMKKDNMLFFVNYSIDFGDNNDDFGTEFMNKTIDICKMLSNRRYEPLVGLFYRILQERESTLPKKCPIKKRVFAVPFSDIETDKMPPIWPETPIRFIQKHYIYDQSILKPLPEEVVARLNFYKSHFYRPRK